MVSEKMTKGLFNPKDVKGVEGSSLSIDLKKYDKKETSIAVAEIVQVPSQFTETKKQWSLRVQSEVLETAEGEEGPIEFRASELFNLVQDDEGKLEGFPRTEGSNLMRFLKDLGVKGADKFTNLQEVIDSIIGKKTLIKSYEKNSDGRTKTFLRFRY
ncbi:MAG: hypothetical protein ACHQ1D_01080 [Nitrososphaerales archaeon]